MLSRFENDETENIELPVLIFLVKEILIKARQLMVLIVNPLGAGVYQNFSRNKLNIKVYNASLKGSIDKGKHFIQFGQ